MENQQEIRQSTGKNITDFIKGATLGLLNVPVHLYQSVTGIDPTPLPKEKYSLSFRSGYAVAGAGALLLGGGYLMYKLWSSRHGNCPETL